jgi:hypothetical protein
METLRTLFVDPFMNLFGQVTGFIPTLVSALIVLAVGLVIAKVLRHIMHEIFKTAKLDGVADKIGLSGALKKGGVKSKVSELVSSFVYFIVLIVFLIMTVDLIGLSAMLSLLDRMVTYVPQVFSAVIVLALGLIIAKIVSGMISVVAHYTNTPKPELMERITRWAVILYAATIALGELGYGAILAGQTFHILFGGIVFAFALAFGLGGRDAAAKYLDKKG